MEIVAAHDEERQARDYQGLVGLIVGLALGAVVLARVGGLPHLPASLPTWHRITSTLRGSYLPLSIVGYVLVMLAWAVWFWIVASLLLRLIVGLAQRIRGESPWVDALRAISDRVTLPVVRRAADGALLTVFVANMVSRSALGVAAAAPPPATPRAATVQLTTSVATARQDQRSRSIKYTVQPGDTLWAIAQHFYGTGEEFPRLVAANVGRVMPDGERFTQAGVIQPGWILRVTLPSQAVEEAGGHSYYVIEEGDTLQGVAARLLGGENRWTELFDLNRDRARLNGHVLTDPNLIWPGLRLRLPGPPAAATGHQPAAGGPRSSPPKKPRTTPTPIVPTPTPIPATARPVPLPPTPVAVPTSVAVTRPGASPSADDIGLITGAAGAAAVGAGVAALLLRRRVRRSLDEPPVPAPSVGPPPGDDFLETEPDRTLAHHLHGETDPVVLVAERASRFFAGQGIPVAVIWTECGRDAVTLLLVVPYADRMRILELATSFGTRLGGRGRAVVTPDGDVALQVAGLKGAALLSPTGRLSTGLPILPLGVLPGEDALSVNWRELGHVLVAGLPGEGADITLTSLLAALTAHGHPDALRLWIIADHHLLPAQLRQLPHAAEVIDPNDADRVHEALGAVRAELLRRMRAAEGKEEPRRPSGEEPELVLVVGELTELADDGTTLELIGTEGPRYGVRLLAATTRADATGDMLAHFPTRLVLMTMDDAESIRLLGRPEAADLGSGEFLARLAGRSPLRVRGFQVAPEHLDALIRVMQEAYDTESSAPSTAPNVEPEREATLATANESMMLPNDDWVEAMGLTSEEDDIAVDGHLNGHVAPEDAAIEDVIAQAADVADVVQAEEENAPDRAEQDLVDVEDEREMVAASDRSGEEAAARPVVEVRCFGGFTVESEGRELTSAREEGASHKAWELLAFLSVQPAGAVPKDRLLAAVWPDVDPERAASRMRQAMSRLRSAFARQVPTLTSEVVRADRDGICRLETTLITSDVHRFVALLHQAASVRSEAARAALQEARLLYRGDLLSGPTARDYEWLDERDESGVTIREHYRAQYHQATVKLARLYDEEGRADLAVPLYKEILRAEPTLEDVVRDLYRCYQQLGDLTSLIREDRHLRQALREVDAALGGENSDGGEYQPEPETLVLFGEIRQELRMRAAGKTDTE